MVTSKHELLSSFSGGQFEPVCTGQFKPDLGGQVKPDWGGQFHRILHLNDLIFRLQLPSFSISKAILFTTATTPPTTYTILPTTPINTTNTLGFHFKKFEICIK